MAGDTAYDALIDAAEAPRWAYGTGFADPLAALPAEVPAGVDAGTLARRCLSLADDALVFSHRLSEWLTRAPELEEETALANIALDHLGHARWLYTRAGQADGTGRGEDDFAFTRDPADFRNVCLVELADADFAGLVVRLLAVSVWRALLFDRLRAAGDPVLAALAVKAGVEVAYHREYAADWVVRLGDGTPYSQERAQAAVAALAPWLDELFADPDAGPRAAFDAALGEVLARATLDPSAAVAATPAPVDGRAGRHTDELAPLLAELQSVARAHPGARW